MDEGLNLEHEVRQLAQRIQTEKNLKPSKAWELLRDTVLFERTIASTNHKVAEFIDKYIKSFATLGMSTFPMHVHTHLPYVIDYHIHSPDPETVLIIDGHDWKVYIPVRENKVTDIFLVIPDENIALEIKDALKGEYTEGGFGFIYGIKEIPDGLFHCWSHGNPDRVKRDDYAINEKTKERMKNLKEWFEEITAK